LEEPREPEATEAGTQPAEDLGTPIVDESAGKRVAVGGEAGGGSDIDPAYELALQLLGRPQAMPSPMSQTALVMTDPEAAELARLITRLRQAAGGPAPSLIETLNAGTGEIGPVEDFLKALLEEPPDRARVQAAADEVRSAGPEVAAALDEVVDHPGIEARLAAV
jgi:hypothetical protein